MYLPYIRGKQYEFIALRELSEDLPAKLFCPIIEPVRDNARPLIKTLEVLNEKGIEPLVIVNPNVGQLIGNTDFIDKLQSSELNFIPCIKMYDSEDLQAKELISRFEDHPFAVHVEGGVDKGVISLAENAEWLIVSEQTSPNVLSHLKRHSAKIAIIGDFFEKEIKNADYPIESQYTHWHVSYKDFADGYSDYTILPKSFSESGGPAYVVAIHASYVNRDKFDELYVRHYKSKDNGSPADPGGKFLEALELLFNDIGAGIPFATTTGLGELIELKEQQRFPGLGHVKKLSIKHHIETITQYIAQAGE